jgi:hypothetical protein
MKIMRVDRKNVYTTDLLNYRRLEFEEINHPVPNDTKYHYDAVAIIMGDKKAYVREYGGGDGWARAWARQKPTDISNSAIPIEDAERILEDVKTALAEKNSADRQAELSRIMDDVFARFT